jgi:hypothetical protein
MRKQSPVKLFITYSHKDEALRQALCEHLASLQREGLIDVWHDRKIGAGQEWQGKIDDNLEKADIVLCLVSASFLASDYCQDIEIKRALERHECGEACIIPILLRPVNWSDSTLGKLQALPTNAKPVTTWSNRDQANTSIVKGIKEIALNLRDRQGKHLRPEHEKNHQSATSQSDQCQDDSTVTNEIGLPFLPQLYIERDSVEHKCYKAIETPCAFIRIKGPWQMGKTSLMAKILDHAHKCGFATVRLSIQAAGSRVLSDYELLLKWICFNTARELGLNPSMEEYWDSIFGPNENYRDYLARYLLPKIGSGLVLALDEVDLIGQNPGLEADFFGLLRALHEEGRFKKEKELQKISFIIAHSFEFHLTDINQSPFNVGLPIVMPLFDLAETLDLSRRFGLNLAEDQLNEMMGLLNGHPFLLQEAFGAIASGSLALQEIFSSVNVKNRLFGDHLSHFSMLLESKPDLKQAMKEVVHAETPVVLSSSNILSLKSLGLIAEEASGAKPANLLYKEYFCRYLQ